MLKKIKYLAMNNLIKLVVLMVLSIGALYMNVWWLIPIMGLVYGYLSEGNAFKSGLIAFAGVAVVWTILLYVREGQFATTPSQLFANNLGNISPALLPLIGGVVCALPTLFTAAGGRLLAEKS